METTLKRHGGHNADTPSPRATGRGAVWRLRQALPRADGRTGWTRKMLAKRILCSVDTIRRAEKLGIMIDNAAVRANLTALASQHGLTALLE